MIAKAILKYNSDSIKIPAIITLATPHRNPVVTLDQSLAKFYGSVNELWQEPSVSQNISLASIGGADRDIQVRSGLIVAHVPSTNVLVIKVF